MSAGHKHNRPNLLVPGPKLLAALHRLLTQGGAVQLMRRFNNVNFDCDIPYAAGYNVPGTVRFVDKDFAHAIYDEGYSRKIIGAPIDTGMSPDDTLACVLWHEAVEKVIIDADNPVDLYDKHDSPHGFGAHEYATAAEHELVKRKGGTPFKYERGLAPIIKFCEKKEIEKITKDFSCAPYLDDPDANARRILARFQELGVEDAFKISKDKVQYSKSVSEDKCAGCENWLNHFYGQGLSTCKLIAGLVRDSHWCSKYEDRDDDTAGGDLETAGAERGSDQAGSGSQANAAAGGSQDLQQGPPGRGQGNPPE